MTTANSELAKAIYRVADIVQGCTERYGIYADGRAVIDQHVVLYAMFDLNPESYFAPREPEEPDFVVGPLATDPA